MILEIFVGVIAAAFVLLNVFIIFSMYKFNQILKKADRTITHVYKKIDTFSESGIELINHVDKLTKDITKKSEALDVLFSPLHSKKKKLGNDLKNVKGRVIADSLTFLADGIVLFDEIKAKIKGNVHKK